MADCPLISMCPCRRSAAGAAVCAGSVWTALHAPVFLGANFAAMVSSLVYPPHIFQPALAAWCLVTAASLWAVIWNIRAAMEEGDDARTWTASLAAIGGGAAALVYGWHLPGPFWSAVSDGLCTAAIAFGGANVSLSFAARAYETGYLAGSLARIGRFGFAEMPGVDDDEWHRAQATIATLTAERNRLADDLARVGRPARDLEEVLRYPGVAEAVLKAARKATHRDSFPGIGEGEARILDERFKKVSAVLERFVG
jgi:hypothetical protein